MPSTYSTSAEIAAAKNAAFVASVDMSTFVGKKIEAITGKPTPACAVTAAAVNVPVARTAAFVSRVKGRPVHLAISGANDGVRRQGEVRCGVSVDRAL